MTPEAFENHKQEYASMRKRLATLRAAHTGDVTPTNHLPVEWYDLIARSVSVAKALAEHLTEGL
jgi:hypothetical protein